MSGEPYKAANRVGLTKDTPRDFFEDLFKPKVTAPGPTGYSLDPNLGAPQETLPLHHKVVEALSGKPSDFYEYDETWVPNEGTLAPYNLAC